MGKTPVRTLVFKNKPHRQLWASKSKVKVMDDRKKCQIWKRRVKIHQITLTQPLYSHILPLQGTMLSIHGDAGWDVCGHICMCHLLDQGLASNSTGLWWEQQHQCFASEQREVYSCCVRDCDWGLFQSLSQISCATLGKSLRDFLPSVLMLGVVLLPVFALSFVVKLNWDSNDEDILFSV